MAIYRILETRRLLIEHEIEADSWEEAEDYARFQHGECVDETSEYDWDGVEPEERDECE